MQRWPVNQLMIKKRPYSLKRITGGRCERLLAAPTPVKKRGVIVQAIGKLKARAMMFLLRSCARRLPLL